MVFLLIRIMRLCRGRRRTMHRITASTRTASTRTTASMFHPLETSPSHKCQATVLHPFLANLLQGFQVTPKEHTIGFKGLKEMVVSTYSN